MEHRVTGNVIGAVFDHTTSRTLDPQLHTHLVLFNASYDAQENRWKALQTGKMCEGIKYCTAVYRHELTKRLHAMGYETRASARGFEITGVKLEWIERFSKRSQQRNEAVNREEAHLGRKLSNDEISHLVHRTRPNKLHHASTEEVRRLQLKETRA
jgi:conjugative relaxase-like TrwC/TraI family protein